MMLLDVVDERRGSPREWAKNYKAARKRLMNPVKPLPPVKMAPVTWAFGKLRTPLGVAMHVDVAVTVKMPITSYRIIRAAASFYGYDPDELISPLRRSGLVKARHVAMYLSKKLARLSLPAIGRRFGGRDHTTVIHGLRKVEAALTDPDSPFHADIAEIRAMLEA